MAHERPTMPLGDPVMAVLWRHVVGRAWHRTTPVSIHVRNHIADRIRHSMRRRIEDPVWRPVWEHIGLTYVIDPQ